MIFGKDAGNVVGGEPSVNFVVDHHDGSQSAGADTAARIQRKTPVRSALSVGDAKKLFQF